MPVQGILAYFIVMNLLGIVLMAMDKQKAIRHQWRVSEKTLFLVALLGGSIGAWAGMYLFRHKTKKWYFRIGIPVILLVQILAAWAVKCQLGIVL